MRRQSQGDAVPPPGRRQTTNTSNGVSACSCYRWRMARRGTHEGGPGDYPDRDLVLVMALVLYDIIKRLETPRKLVEHGSACCIEAATLDETALRREVHALVNSQHLASGSGAVKEGHSYQRPIDSSVRWTSAGGPTASAAIITPADDLWLGLVDNWTNKVEGGSDG